ncbi:MAG: hypothetical protein Q7S63_00645 [bacterium]|nr:hypothetical protein [bacterium]
MEQIILGGIIGGVVRGLVGFVKYRYSYKDVKFDIVKLSSTAAISGLVGLISSFTVKELGFSFLGAPSMSFAMAIIVGYAGGDFLENLYKIILKNPSLTVPPEQPK